MTSAARIIAITVAGITLLGLSYLRFTRDPASTSVPRGAHPGQLTLRPCRYSTAGGAYGADCGTLVVPENRHEADSRLIALPVVRIRARSAQAGLPIFRLQGGPGVTNMDFPDASRFAGAHDVVLVGYRGVDGSSRLDCPEVTAAREHAGDFLSARSFQDDADAFRACAARLRRASVDLAGYTLPERVDDLDAARRALGYRRIDLLSESAGTRTALIYAWRYPTRIQRSVMIGVNPPGGFLWDAETVGELIRRYAALCAADGSCRRRAPDLSLSLHRAFERIPSSWWWLPVKRGNARAAAFFGLMDATTGGGGPLSGPMTIDAMLAASRGDAGGTWLLSLMAELLYPRAQVWGDVAAVARSDAAYARRFFAARRDQGSVIGSPGTDLLWAGGRLLDVWPSSPDEHEYTQVRDSGVPTLLIGGSLDFATPPQNATRQLLPHLRRAHQVVLPNLGHTDDFWTYEPAAGTHLIDTFFATGRIDPSGYSPNRIAFTPSTGLGAIATIVLASMLILSATTILSLLWMARRVRRGAPFRRAKSAIIRSVYAIVLGLGGWFTGLLIVLTALPNVPLQDETLALLSTSLSAGLTVYLAWVHRDSAAQTKAIGLAGAAGGGLLGAFLGFGATSAGFGLLAPLFAVVGAVAAANLAILVFDTARRPASYATGVAEPASSAAVSAVCSVPR